MKSRTRRERHRDENVPSEYRGESTTNSSLNIVNQKGLKRQKKIKKGKGRARVV